MTSKVLFLEALRVLFLLSLSFLREPHVNHSAHRGIAPDPRVLNSGAVAHHTRTIVMPVIYSIAYRRWKPPMSSSARTVEVRGKESILLL